MSSNSTPMIQELRADFEKVLNMVTSPEAATATLDQMERSVLRQILCLGLKLLKLFLQTRVAAESHQPLRVGRKRWAYHSQKERDYFSFFGKLTFARAYFYSKRHGGKSPLDEALSVPEQCYSDLLTESAELLAVEGSYAKGLRVLARLLDIDLSEAAVEMTAAEHAQAVETFYAQQAPPPVKEEGVLLVAQADGKGVPLVRPADDVPKTVRRGKGAKKTRKKEAIATALYTIDRYPRTPQEVVNALFRKPTTTEARPAPCGKRVFASLDGKAAALERLASWAHQREGKHIRGRVALTDGAKALQTQTQTHLPGFTLVLDVLHVNEHLWKAGTAVYGETHPQRERWVEAQLRDLLASRGKTVIRRLEKQRAGLAPSGAAGRTLRQVAQYLRHNLPYLDYAAYLRRGWPIGTGVVEGTCRHLVKDRMELSGMRWTVPGAEAILALRAVNENGDWETFHTFRRTERHQRLYGKPMNTAWLDHAEHFQIN
ncbi:MAG: ISKra4 family transposase [Chloroflexota bacterium]